MYDVEIETLTGQKLFQKIMSIEAYRDFCKKLTCESYKYEDNVFGIMQCEVYKLILNTR